jgi:hypothetical protein
MWNDWVRGVIVGWIGAHEGVLWDDCTEDEVGGTYYIVSEVVSSTTLQNGRFEFEQAH